MADSATADAPVRLMVNGLHAKSGGGVTYLREMAPRLAARDDISLSVVLNGAQHELFDFSGAGLEIIDAGFRPGFVREILWEQLSLPAAARRAGTELLFSPANFGPLCGPASVILLRNALEVSRHDRRLSKTIYWKALSLMTRLSARRATHILAVSAYAAGALARPGAAARAGVTVIHHGVSPDFSPAAGPKPETAAPYLLAVGDLYVQKNFHTLIEVFARLENKFPALELRIAGAVLDPEYRVLLEETARRHRVQDRVKFLGRQDMQSLLGLYRGCSIFIFPSTAETFGQPLVEAMACGAPVVASNTTAIPEIVRDGAILCDPFDVDQFADGIEGLMVDAKARDALARAALRRAAAFSWDRCADETAAVLVAAARKP